MLKTLRAMVWEASIDFFMPAVVLWRYLVAPEGAKTISIEYPFR